MIGLGRRGRGVTLDGATAGKASLENSSATSVKSLLVRLESVKPRLALKGLPPKEQAGVLPTEQALPPKGLLRVFQAPLKGGCRAGGLVASSCFLQVTSKAMPET